MKRFGTPGRDTQQQDIVQQRAVEHAPHELGSNQALMQQAGLQKGEDEEGLGFLSRAWSGVRRFGRSLGDGAKGGAVVGAGVGALPGAAVGGALGAAAGAAGGKESAVKGGGIGAALLGLPGALAGGLLGAVGGAIHRGIDELRADDAALLAKTGGISGYHVILEQLAHVYAYGKGDEKTLETWGYALGDEHEDKNSGLRVVSFRPRNRDALDPDGRPLRPVVAFRGTANLGGALDDANDQGIGTFQFSRNEREIQNVLQGAGSAPDVTGHSLGGALAQLAAARLGSMVGDIVTFQSPGIEGAEAQRIDKDKHAATHYRAGGDLVSDAGEAFAIGEVFTFERKGPDSPLSHMTYPLAQLNALRAASDADTPVVPGVRSSDDEWVIEKKGDFHNGHWADQEGRTESHLMDVQHHADAQEAPTTTLTRVAGAAFGGGRALAEGARDLVGAHAGLSERQSDYARAWRQIRAVCMTVTKPSEVSGVRKQVVDLILELGVEPRDHGRFISQAEAAMIDALEDSPLNVGGPAPA